MSYTFVKITSFYRNFLREYYRENPRVTALSYEDQFSHLMSQQYGYSDYFARRFRESGVRAYEIIYNAEPMQKAWAVENGSLKEGTALLIDQLKVLKPEVVMFQDSTGFTAEFIRKIREEVKSVKLITGLYCSPFTSETLRSYREYDFLLCCSPRFVDLIRQEGGKPYLFYHSFEPRVAEQRQPAAKIYDLMFVGSFVTQKDFHSGRLAFLEGLLAEGLPVSIVGDIRQDSALQLFPKQAVYVTAKFLKTLGFNRLLGKMPLFKKFLLLNEMPVKTDVSGLMLSHLVSGPVFGRKMYDYISGSRIGLNVHAGVAGDYAANIRMFETTGVGSLLLTDHKKNIADLFEPGEEIVVYDSVEDCAGKIRWLLSHEKELMDIARKGQQRTLRDHTVAKRVDYLNGIITGLLQG